MISLSHHPIVQDVIDRWRMSLPVPVQLDESLVTKEHLRLLISMLIRAVENLAAFPPASDIQHSTSDLCS